MKRRPPIIKELEASEVALGRLRADRARIDAQIAALQQRREADVQQLVLDTTKRLNLAHLPAASIVAGLEQLARSACVDRPVPDPGGTGANSSDDPQDELAPVIVRLTCNTSAVNRVMLENAGVRWNGRARGWTGRVTPDALRHLSEVFPGRVEGPARKSSATQPDDKAGPALEAEGPITSPDPSPANVEAEAVARTQDGASNEAAAKEGAIAPAQPAVSAATRLMTPQYRPGLPRRPLPT